MGWRGSGPFQSAKVNSPKQSVCHSRFLTWIVITIGAHIVVGTFMAQIKCLMDDYTVRTSSEKEI